MAVSDFDFAALTAQTLQRYGKEKIYRTPCWVYNSGCSPDEDDADLLLGDLGCFAMASANVTSRGGASRVNCDGDARHGDVVGGGEGPSSASVGGSAKAIGLLPFAFFLVGVVVEEEWPPPFIVLLLPLLLLPVLSPFSL